MRFASGVVTAFSCLDIVLAQFFVITKENGECVYCELGQYVVTLSHVLRYYNLFFTIPCVIVTVCNIIFVRKLRSRGTRKQQGNNTATDITTGKKANIRNHHRQIQKRKKLQEYMKMILIMSTAYLVFTLSIVINVFLMAIAVSNSALWLLFKSITTIFAIVNTSDNFLFYVMSGKSYR